MKLLILSDLHLDHANFELADNLEFDAIVMPGDLCNSGIHGVKWLAQPEFNKGKPVIYVAGNHEFYEYTMPKTFAVMRQQAADLGIHFLHCGELILNGIRFLGCTLWTDWQLSIDGKSNPLKAMTEAGLYMMDFRLINPTNNDRIFLKPQDTLAWHQHEREWLLDKLNQPFDGKTVVITHHAPHRLSLAKEYAHHWISPAFVSEMPDSAFRKANLWVHGHTHSSFDYEVEGCRVICNPRGYFNSQKGEFEVTSFNPNLVVDV